MNKQGNKMLAASVLPAAVALGGEVAKEGCVTIRNMYCAVLLLCLLALGSPGRAQFTWTGGNPQLKGTKNLEEIEAGHGIMAFSGVVLGNTNFDCTYAGAYPPSAIQQINLSLRCIRFGGDGFSTPVNVPVGYNPQYVGVVVNNPLKAWQGNEGAPCTANSLDEGKFGVTEGTLNWNWGGWVVFRKPWRSTWKATLHYTADSDGTDGQPLHLEPKSYEIPQMEYIPPLGESNLVVRTYKGDVTNYLPGMQVTVSHIELPWMNHSGPTDNIGFFEGKYPANDSVMLTIVPPEGSTLQSIQGIVTMPGPGKTKTVRLAWPPNGNGAPTLTEEVEDDTGGTTTGGSTGGGEYTGPPGDDNWWVRMFGPPSGQERERWMALRERLINWGPVGWCKNTMAAVSCAFGGCSQDCGPYETNTDANAETGGCMWDWQLTQPDGSDPVGNPMVVSYHRYDWRAARPPQNPYPDGGRGSLMGSARLLVRQAVGVAVYAIFAIAFWTRYLKPRLNL